MVSPGCSSTSSLGENNQQPVPLDGAPPSITPERSAPPTNSACHTPPSSARRATGSQGEQNASGTPKRSPFAALTPMSKKRAKKAARMRAYRSRIKLGKTPVVAPTSIGEASQHVGKERPSQPQELNHLSTGLADVPQPCEAVRPDTERVSRVKRNQRQFMGNEFARLFHVIFDDSDEGHSRLDRLMTGMTRHQVDACASDPCLKNVWHEIEECFNDVYFRPKNALPNNELCGEDIIDPQEPMFTGLQSRSWEKLKSVWGGIRGDITCSLANWNKSGSNDPEDVSDVWKFCNGKAWLLYIWLTAWYMDGGGGTRFLDIIVKSLGSEIDNEDGIEDGNDALVSDDNRRCTIQAIAHRKRQRKSVTSLYQKESTTDDAQATRIQDKVESILDSFKQPSFERDLQLKQMEIDMEKEARYDDRMASMLASNYCPPELREELVAYFASELKKRRVQK